MTGIPVLATPFIDPTRDRVEMVMPVGTTIAEMVKAALPNLSEGMHRFLRVSIGDQLIMPGMWHRVRPREGASVVIRLVPGNGNMRTVLAVVVSIAAIAAGQFYAPMLLGATGIGVTATSLGIAKGIITAGVMFAGNLLINALIPVREDTGRNESPTYSVQGWRNVEAPNGVVPSLLGKHRVAPPFAASSHTESVKDHRYVRGLFVLGYGPINISNIKIGDTPISSFGDDVEIETRQGYPSDEPITLYQGQVIEEQITVELSREPDGPTEPIRRLSAPDAEELSVDIHFPAGLIGWYPKSGDERSGTVNFRIRQRRVGVNTWTVVQEFSITARTHKEFTRTIRWAVPERGQYEVEVVRFTERHKQFSHQTQLVCLRSHKPEYALNFDKPIAVIAMRVKASKVANGILDSLNCIAQRICLDYNHTTGTWVTRATRNPASLFRYVLQGPENPFPKTDAQINIAQLESWHDYCRVNGLTYDRVHDYDASIEEVLADIAAAGRATPQDQGTRIGVVIDRPQTTVAAHISPRNSWDFSGSISYARFPDGFRVTFYDETNDYAQAERIVPWPGFAGSPLIVEELSLPGVTNPAQVWKECRKRQYELIRRPHTYTVHQDIENLIAMRGDLVRLSHDVLSEEQVAARVRSVTGTMVELDEPVRMIAGVDYACRFRRTANGTSRFRTVLTVAGERKVINLTGTGVSPDVGDLLFFGRHGLESRECVIKDVENGEDFTAVLTLIDHAPEIAELVDNDVPPPWDGRVGLEVPDVIVAPGIPVVTEIISGMDEEYQPGDPYPPVIVLLGAGNETRVITFEVGHRLGTSGPWTSVSVLAIEGSASITGYGQDDAIQIRVRAVGQTGLASAWSSPVAHIVGEGDPVALPAPTALVASVVNETVTLTWRNPNDPRMFAAAVFRAPQGQSLSEATQIAGPLYGGPGALAAYDDTPGYGEWTYFVIGADETGIAMSPPASIDATLIGPELIENGGFDAELPWLLDNMTIVDGVARKVEDEEGSVSQAVALAPGGIYRVVFTIKDRGASGGVTARLTGGATVAGTLRTANGTFTQDLTAVAGNDTLTLATTITGRLDIDDVSLRRVR